MSKQALQGSRIPQERQAQSTRIMQLLPVQGPTEKQHTGQSVSVSHKVIPDWEQLCQHKHTQLLQPYRQLVEKG